MENIVRVVLFRGTWRTLEACRSTTPRRCSVCMTTPTSLSHRTRPTRCWPRCCCCSRRSAQAADAHSRRYNVVILCSFAPGLTIGSVQQLKMETHPPLSFPPLLFSFPLFPHFPLSYCFSSIIPHIPLLLPLLTLFLTILATNISLLPLWRNYSELQTYVTSLILSKKLIFTTKKVMMFINIFIVVV